MQTTTLKNTNKYKNVAPRLQKYLQNGAQSALGTWFFRLWPILDFVQLYKVLFDFHGFRVPRGDQKTIKKRFRKKNVEKAGPKPIFLQTNAKNEPNMSSDFDHEFSPNSPPRGHCSNLGPKGTKKEPKGAKRVLKDTKRIQKGAKRIPKSYENQ